MYEGKVYEVTCTVCKNMRVVTGAKKAKEACPTCGRKNNLSLKRITNAI